MEEVPVPLPSAPLIQLAPNATLQPPLTRRGYGPGLIITMPGNSHFTSNTHEHGETEKSANGGPGTLDPPPQKKWAEEGYAVVQIESRNESQSNKEWDIATALGLAIEALDKLEACEAKIGFGLIIYGAPTNYAPDFASKLKAAYEPEERLIASVSFSLDWTLSLKPELVHLPGSPSPLSSTSLPSSRPNTRRHHYSAAQSPSFIHPGSADFHYASAGLSHTWSLTFLKAQLGGPIFDLEAIWDEHTAHEFATRSVARTMGTMVDEPYVNHVPVLTGGMGRAALTRFYAERFIFSNPGDAALGLVSRTVGVDRVVDEFVFSLTHDRVVDWLLPGVPPTHKKLRIPFTSVVNIRGDRLYHEHILWDQGTALAQAGLLPKYLPFPYALPDGRAPAAGKRFEYRVPVAGAETAAKLEDGGAAASNGMFEFAVREVDA
ncbi:hypothetical protein F5Y19DRAFT_183634 [Xylariaceae sp. FL1651]|nr:hypothetical protein F5Y19DRAFT_183634 [Xylariaceae sp. FL1651]